MRRTLLAMLLLLGFAATAAETDSIDSKKSNWKINIAADVRADFSYQDTPDDVHHSGFYGRYLNVMIDGEINSKFNYHFRQRLNKFSDLGNDVFSATDWIYINYQPTEHWVFSAGKQVVAIGGFEYDRAAIDIFYASMFWNNIACYQFGVSGSYVTSGGNHTILAQVCNSPYQKIGQSCYAYNIMWMGKMGCYRTIWSTNVIEYARGKYASFISLGNRIDFSHGYAELDLMNRYSGHQRYLFDDYSIIGKVCVNIRKVDIFAKGGYERFRPEIGVDNAVTKPFYGMGVEYYPLRKSRDLRLHVVADVTHNNDGVRTTEIAAGVKWRMDLYTRR